MLATVHLAVGALIGKYVAPWPWALVVAFLSHFFLDALPHTDPGILKESPQRGTMNLAELLLAFADLVLALIVLLGLSRTLYFTDNVVAGAIGGIAPDFAHGLFWAFPALKTVPPFSWYSDFHRRIQGTVEKKEWLAGLISNLVVFTLAVYLFLK